MQARYWKPVNRRVEPSPNDATFGYIAPNGDLRPTKTTTKDSWSVRSIYSCSKLLDRRRALSRTIQDAYYRLQDRRFNICLINEHTVPKWIPSVRHLSMDPATALSQVVEKLLGGSHLVLRCKQLEPNSNQCELWTFSLRTKTMTRDYVTVAEGIAARGKTPATSARKHTRMMAVQVTKALQC